MALVRGRRLVGGGGGPARGQGKGSVVSAAMGRESTMGGVGQRKRARALDSGGDTRLSDRGVVLLFRLANRNPQPCTVFRSRTNKIKVH